MSNELDLGKKSNYHRLYSEMYTGLKYFATKILNSEDEAEDIIQDVWLKVWDKKPVFENKHKLKAYLYQSVKNTALNQIRISNKRDKHHTQLLIDQIEDDISSKIIESEVYALINHTFSKLSEATKRVYVEKLNGKKYKEIAEDLDISVNTVKKHINNANHYMKDNLKHLLEFILLFC
ncbi:sigma-70 family RNA polymerase sigma factor [Plebeiibacterium marinum]|uniref:Sigma-70 family RNA polymerase sigma factor n=1 Tax=Plebeiibacterium marinum TaxID=2992111 RepID=A0AAE3MBP1_9BACT|nr:sigma-70 family RNA polymerase sigma factor [Plebeiobacterium marinum]MCW3804750.1 sigma-70 family RNA polymerase sigma factor [Plebeiobacterium marinum]